MSLEDREGLHHLLDLAQVLSVTNLGTEHDVELSTEKVLAAFSDACQGRMTASDVISFVNGHLLVKVSIEVLRQDCLPQNELS